MNEINLMELYFWHFLAILTLGTFGGAYLVDYFFPVRSDKQRHWRYEPIEHSKNTKNHH